MKLKLNIWRQKNARDKGKMVTYEVDGKQYVSLLVGWGGTGASMVGSIAATRDNRHIRIDALSHLLLPGIVLGFLITGSKTPLILVLGAIGVGIYLYLNPDKAGDWLQGTPLAPEPEITRVYQWRDAQGSWRITDQPPPAGIDYELKEYRADVNVLPLPPQLEQ